MLLLRAVASLSKAATDSNNWEMIKTVDLTITHKFSINTETMKSTFIKFKIISSQNNDAKCHIGNIQISPVFSKYKLDHLQ